MAKILTLGKKYLILIIIILIIIIAGLGYFIWSKKSNGNGQIYTVQLKDFTQTVSASGKVIPAQSVDLSFNRNGRVVRANKIVGQNVGAGEIIAEIDSREAFLSLENARIELKKILENSAALSSAGLTKDYEDGLISVDRTFLEIKSIFEGLDTILHNYQVSTYKINLPNDTTRNYYQSASASYYRFQKDYQTALTNYRQLKRPLTDKKTIVALIEDTYNLTQTLAQTIKETDIFLSSTYDSLNETSRPTDLIADKNKVADWNIKVTESISSLNNYRDRLKDSGFNIQAQELVVRQRELAYQDSFLRAPFNGVLTKQDFKVGEIVSVGQIGASLIGRDLLQIESFIPEVNIAELKIGNLAEITLDAYDTKTIFEAKVIAIDPAETMRQGVSTYRVKLQFSKMDERIKPGMTANLIIQTSQHPNVLAIPASAIYTRDGQRYVKIMLQDKIVEQAVVLGKIGALRETEILEGLKPGDRVILGSDN